MMSRETMRASTRAATGPATGQSSRRPRFGAAGSSLVCLLGAVVALPAAQYPFQDPDLPAEESPISSGA